MKKYVITRGGYIARAIDNKMAEGIVILGKKDLYCYNPDGGEEYTVKGMVDNPNLDCTEISYRDAVMCGYPFYIEMSEQELQAERASVSITVQRTLTSPACEYEKLIALELLMDIKGDYLTPVDDYDKIPDHVYGMVLNNIYDIMDVVLGAKVTVE